MGLSPLTIQLTGHHVELDDVPTLELLGAHMGSTVDADWYHRLVEASDCVRSNLVHGKMSSGHPGLSLSMFVAPTIQRITKSVWVFTGLRPFGEYVEFWRVPITKRLIFEYLGGTEPRFFDSTAELEESISSQLLSSWARSLDFGVVWSSGLAYRGTADVSDLRPTRMVEEHVRRIAHIRAGLTRPEDMSDDVWKMVASDLDCCALWNRFLHTHEMS